MNSHWEVRRQDITSRCYCIPVGSMSFWTLLVFAPITAVDAADAEDLFHPSGIFCHFRPPHINEFRNLEFPARDVNCSFSVMPISRSNTFAITPFWSPKMGPCFTEMLSRDQSLLQHVPTHQFWQVISDSGSDQSIGRRPEITLMVHISLRRSLLIPLQALLADFANKINLRSRWFYPDTQACRCGRRMWKIGRRWMTPQGTTLP